MRYVYVLLSDRDRKFYIGSTSNVLGRLDGHNAGTTTSTRPRRQFQLLYYEAHTSNTDALRRERYFKTAKGKTTLRQVLRDALYSKE